MYDALYNLGTVLAKAGRRDEARPYLERFVREAPRSRYDADIRRIEPLAGALIRPQAMLERRDR